MSSMFKKKTGPSIKPKLVPRGRAAAPSSASASAAASPAPPSSSASATTSPAPQPPRNPVESAQRTHAKSQQGGEFPTPPSSKPNDVRTPTEQSSASPQAPPTDSLKPTDHVQHVSDSAADLHATSPKNPRLPSATRSTDSDSEQITSGSAAPATPASLNAAAQTAERPLAAAAASPKLPPSTTRTKAIPLAEGSQSSPWTDDARLPNSDVSATSTPFVQPAPSPASESTLSINGSEDLATPTATAKPSVKRGRKRKALPNALADASSQGATNPNAGFYDRRGRGEDAPSKPKRQRKKPVPRISADPETEGLNRASRARSETPPDAELQVVDIQTLKMSDLTRDLRIGKKFSRHDELRDRERQDRSRLSGDVVTKASQSPAPPQVIVNGQIVVDQSSLVMDRHARDAVDGPIEEVEENEFTHKVTSNSFRTGSKLRGPNHWSEDDTEKFYHALKRFGTDFEMIAQLFPGRQRRHIKMKFNREEKFSRGRIDAALVGPKRLKMDFEDFKAATGKEYEATADIHAQLKQLEEAQEAAQKQQEEEDAAINRQRLEALHGPGGVPGESEAVVASI
ncbi:unnamed protein product [Parascedosporium putredinis]|uniref:Myb-like domain-containing protein n=1 Tax=Parascedosporium putredinis TaxID=1442378 RepID=A0A9P1MDA9_9PEZI|nr:unnamed protein product [Parascedosporium putredinis]CAI8000112.1 unnamed protein product [Parascedosporium putredinis]